MTATLATSQTLMDGVEYRPPGAGSRMKAKVSIHNADHIKINCGMHRPTVIGLRDLEWNFIVIPNDNKNIYLRLTDGNGKNHTLWMPNYLTNYCKIEKLDGVISAYKERMKKNALDVPQIDDTSNVIDDVDEDFQPNVVAEEPDDIVEATPEVPVVEKPNHSIDNVDEDIESDDIVEATTKDPVVDNHSIDESNVPAADKKKVIAQVQRQYNKYNIKDLKRLPKDKFATFSNAYVNLETMHFWIDEDQFCVRDVSTGTYKWFSRPCRFYWLKTHGMASSDVRILDDKKIIYDFPCEGTWISQAYIETVLRIVGKEQVMVNPNELHKTYKS